ncbi:MAG: diguanylate cyclase, partial [Methylococcales bacterium]|nr:diguanylate cyclase [Methylococcales bacterium]
MMPEQQTVLVIDNSTETLEMLRSEMDVHEFQLVYAETGDHAKKLIKDKKPDLIIIDPEFCGIDGFNICREMKRNEMFYSIPVIFITYLGMVEDKVKGFEAGAIDYLVKPCESLEVIIRVRSALRKKQYQDVLSNLSHIDPITGLWNQKHFDRRLSEQFASFVRYDRHFSLFILEVDHFKEIENKDVIGKVVNAITRLLWAHCRVCDILSYWGQGRFALLLPETGLWGAKILAERLRAEVEVLFKKNELDNHKHKLTASISVIASEIFAKITKLSTQHILTATKTVVENIQTRGGNAIECVYEKDLNESELLLSEKTLGEISEADQQRQQYEYLILAHQTATALSGRPEVDNLLNTFLKQAMHFLDAKHGLACIFNPKSDALSCKLGVGCYEAIQGKQVSKNKGFVGEVYSKGQAIIHNVNKNGIRMELGIPIICAEKVIGVMGIAYDDNSSKNFSDKDVEVMSHFSEIASIAMDNIRLYAIAEQELKEREALEQELKTAKQLSENANLAKSTFLANMSHELRTPLNAIIGYGEFLVEEAEEFHHPTFIPDLNKIVGSGHHLLNLIDSILDLSKVEAGRTQLYLENIQLDALLQVIFDTIKPVIERGGNKLVVNVIKTPEKLYIDQTKLKQILLNLLSNAAKFTNNGEIGFIVNTLVDEGNEWVEFRVKDSGIGMTEDQTKKLFHAFVQADTSSTRKYGGTGLGLAISKSFCEMMGGTIDVTSELSVGSTFVVRIPGKMKLSKVDLLSTYKKNQIDRHSSILVVTKNERITQSIHIEGVEIKSVASIEKSLSSINQLLPDIILVDAEIFSSEADFDEIMMCHEESPSIQTIVITHPDNEYLISKSANMDNLDYILKPYNSVKLHSRIRTVLRTKHYMLLLEERAQVDLLTNLWNKTHFNLRLEEEVVSTQRYPRSFTLVEVKISEFKTLFKSSGKDFCDYFITAMAELLTYTCRVCDVPCRCGHDEFIIILPETGMVEVKAFVKRYVKMLQQRTLKIAT